MIQNGIEKVSKIVLGVDFWMLLCSKIDLQNDFADIFYTILDHFDPCVYLESSLKVEI